MALNTTIANITQAMIIRKRSEIDPCPNRRVSIYPCPEGGVSTMGTFKKVMAILLVMTIALSLMVTASAAGSPTTAPKNPGYDASSKKDTNTRDHHDNTVVTKINKTSKVVVKITGKNSNTRSKIVTLKYARNKDNKKVAITTIGDGKTGVFNTKAGRRVTKVLVKSTAKSVVLSAYAFKGSKVKSLAITSSKVTFKKNTFKGTKTKNPTIIISGSKKKASAFTFKKGAFSGLSNKAKIVVRKNTMTEAQFKKLVKKLKTAGFSGKIVRK